MQLLQGRDSTKSHSQYNTYRIHGVEEPNIDSQDPPSTVTNSLYSTRASPLTRCHGNVHPKDSSGNVIATNLGYFIDNKLYSKLANFKFMNNSQFPNLILNSKF